MLFFIFLSILIVNTSAQLEEIGDCVNIPGMKNFQPKKLLGLWYEVRRGDNQMQVHEKCTYFDFSENNNETINIRGHTINMISGAKQHWDATAIPIDNESSAKFEVIFPPYGLIQKTIWTIVDTDYDNFTLSYTCDANDRFSFTTFQVLSRTNKLQDVFMTHVLNIMMNYNVPFTMIIATDQENCPHL